MRRLEDELARYGRTDSYPFHMPGHKRQAALMPDLAPAAIDITEIDGFDNLHDPEDLILEEMTTAADFYHTRKTFFSVNGATCALLAAISAAAPRGSRILIERGCHMAVYHAAYLRGLEPAYISGDLAEKVRCEAGETRDHAETACPKGGLDRTDDPKDDGAAGIGPSISAVVITSPTYEGCVKDVAAWADYAHRRGAVLIVDEAHGAHFSMHPGFPESAVRCGADLVVQSTHKTLPAMTQTALLHNVTGRVSDDRIQYFFDIYETSSPSYVLMASITGAIHLCTDRGEELFGAYLDRLGKLRRRLARLRHYRLMGGEDGRLTCDDELPGFGAGTVTDPGKIVLLGDAPALYAALRDRFRLQPEMKTDTYVLCMTSVADTDEGLTRLAEAMETLDAEAEAAGLPVWTPPEGGEGEASAIFAPQPRAMSLADAPDAPRERVPLAEAVGRVAGDFVILYPPDVPVIVPGEVFTEALVGDIQSRLAAGLNVLGIKDQLADVVKL